MNRESERERKREREREREEREREERETDVGTCTQVNVFGVFLRVYLCVQVCLQRYQR
jgi:hypothetical protein